MATPQLQSIESLITRAKDQPAMALANETYRSYPVPVPAPTGLRVAFLFCPMRSVPGQGRWLLPPTYLALVNAATAKFEKLAAVTPADFGRTDDPTKFLGNYLIPPPGMSTEDFLAQQRSLFAAYDRLLPHFAASDATPPLDLRRIASEFQTVFARLTEPPLAPYYRSTGSEFFAWLGNLSR